MVDVRVMRQAVQPGQERAPLPAITPMASQALRKTCSVRSSASGWLPVRKYRYLYTRSTKRSYNSPNALASRETTTRLTSATTAGSSGPSMFWDGSAPGTDNALESSFVMAVAGARSRSPSTPSFDASSVALPTPGAVRAPTRAPQPISPTPCVGNPSFISASRERRRSSSPRRPSGRRSASTCPASGPPDSRSISSGRPVPCC